MQKRLNHNFVIDVRQIMIYFLVICTLTSDLYLLIPYLFPPCFFNSIYPDTKGYNSLVNHRLYMDCCPVFTKYSCSCTCIGFVFVRVIPPSHFFCSLLAMWYNVYIFVFLHCYVKVHLLVCITTFKTCIYFYTAHLCFYVVENIICLEICDMP